MHFAYVVDECTLRNCECVLTSSMSSSVIVIAGRDLLSYL